MLTARGNRNMSFMVSCYRLKKVALFTALVCLGACASDSPDRAVDSDSPVVTSSINGAAAYNEYCSGCHDTGMLGAPVAGDAGDWADRSQLWDAVLLDHAITGYLEMPARGGRMDLPDEIVKAAAEYMLEITFPNRLHDCNPPACTKNGT